MFPPRRAPRVSSLTHLPDSSNLDTNPRLTVPVFDEDCVEMVAADPWTRAWLAFDHGVRSSMIVLSPAVYYQMVALRAVSKVYFDSCVLF